MAIVAVDPRGRQEFIPESDKEGKNPTKFYFIPLTETEKADIGQQVASSSTGEARIPDAFLTNMVIKHCVGWDNFNDKNGKPIKFTARNINRIPFEVIIEFGSHIFADSGFGAEEEKN